MSKMAPNYPSMKHRLHLGCWIIAMVILLLACKRNHPPSTPDVTGLLLSRPCDTTEFSTASIDQDDDLISYLFAWGDTSSATWSADYPSGVTVTRGHVYADSGAYAVRARARDDKGAESDWSPTETLRVGFFPPGTPIRPVGPTAGLTGIAYDYSTHATSPYGESLFIQLDWGGSPGVWSGPVASDSECIATHTFDSSGLYAVRAWARDKVGRTSNWSDSLMVAVVAQEPYIPARPAGPSRVMIGVATTYRTWSEDPNGDSILYIFDWDDGRMDTTALFHSGDTVSRSHAWSDTGAYILRAKARDSKGNFSVGWSEALVVQAGPNRPPDAPLKPTHTGIDSIGRPIVFTTSATDPDGDSVQTRFYFGDGGTPTYGPKLASGATFTDTAIYQTNGWKVVYAVAKDGRDTSAMSAPDSIFINSPNVAPYAPTIKTEYMPMRGIANGPAYRLYAYARDEYGDSLYYKWYADGNEVATSAAFPSGVDAYAPWTPTNENQTYNLTVRVFDVTGKTNDTMPTTTFQTVTEGQIIWGIAAKFVASPAIGTTLWKDGTWPAIICGSTDEHLYVVDAYQSFLVNQIAVPDPYDYNSSAAIGADGTRYVGNENGRFYAFSPDDNMKWQFGTGDSAMTATAALGSDGSIYCGGEDQRIHKLIDNGASASEAWSYRLRQELTSSPAIGSDGRIFCCDDSGYVYAFNADGSLSWEVRTGDITGITSSPAIASDGTVYVGTEAGHLFALKDGSILWSYAVGSAFSISSSPIIGPDGNIYFTCDDGKFYRIDQNSHLPVANWPVTVSQGSVNSTPLLCADFIIYVADDDSLYAFDTNAPTSPRKWTVALAVPPVKGASPHPRRLSLDNQPSAVVDRYGIIYIATWTGDGGIFAIAGRSSGTLAPTGWPMFHHDAKHTGRFGAR